ncbi:KRI1-like family C-terminal-domain-containing protein, partial [Jimgerdemannia flammicorona]
YILNRGWIDKSADRTPSYKEIVGDDGVDPDEDEEAIEAADRFESSYNFRYEEQCVPWFFLFIRFVTVGAEQLVTHARDIEGSVRRKDDRRKKTRASKEERKQEETLKKMEELKRLKNLKMKEIHDKLKQIQEITGNDSIGVDDVDLEGDFDPTKYDEKMDKAFDDGYYENEENKKPQWDDDIDIGDIVVPDEEDNDDDEVGVSARQESKKRKKVWQDEGENEEQLGWEEDGYNGEEIYGGGGGDDEDFIMDADYLPGGEEFDAVKGKKGKKDRRAAATQEIAPGSKKAQTKEFEKYLEEYYRLDYEDMIGDIPTRFKYQQVRPMNFGLSPVEILLADDQDLNEVIGLKKLAPFRPEEKQQRDLVNFTKSKKKRLKEFRRKLVQQAKEKRLDETLPGPWVPPVLKKRRAREEERRREKEREIKGDGKGEGGKKKKKQKIMNSDGEEEAPVVDVGEKKKKAKTLEN